MKLVFLAALWVPINLSLIIFSLVILLKFHPHTVQASLPPAVHTENLDAVVITPAEDVRISALRQFFQKYDSPLTLYAKVLVEQADFCGLDYTLMPAIAMQESGGCRKIPADSHNCWGFGIYGTKITKFDSCTQAIAQVAKVIKEAYIKNGYSNPTLVEYKWAPLSRGQWSYSVNFFISNIKEYEQRYPA